jgi:uncharacterized protein (TIGR02466 family)
VIQARATNTEISTLPRAELFELFPTPLLRYQWPDSEVLNRELRAAILAKMEEACGRSEWRGSNIGGWHSSKDLHTWPHPCVALFAERIQAMVHEMVARSVGAPRQEHLRNWSFHAWANVSLRGARNASHAHSRERHTIWSGIYYVDAGTAPLDAAASGLTKFEDRSGVPKEIIGNPDPFEREFSVTPEPGLMVLFPSKLWHRVEPFLGSGQRITIAFNLSHPGFVIPDYPQPEGSQPAGLRGWLWRNFRGLMVPASLAKSRMRGPSRPLPAARPGDPPSTA